MAIYYIGCGHGTDSAGRWDPGTTYKGNTEAAYMLPITKAVVKYLRAAGQEVYSDADKNNNINMLAQVRTANEVKADYYVSIHCDWYKAASGTMPLYVTDKGKALGEAINKEVMAALKMPTHGAKYRTDLYELNATDGIACIFETGSIDDDFKYFAQADAYGKAMADGILKYSGNYVAPKKEVTTVIKTKVVYSKKQFVKDIQGAVGAKVTGKCNTQTLKKVPTVSAKKNARHKVVKFMQRRLNTLGYKCGTVDGVAGPKFTAALKKFQKNYKLIQDGEATSGCATWMKLLSL